MAAQKLGELVPVGGGDSIPLTQEVLSVGRRESCDICLKFQNVSSHHCELVFSNGKWTVKDLKSSNGVKINGGERILPYMPRALKPGDEVSIGHHKFTIVYDTAASAFDEPEVEEDLFAPLAHGEGRPRKAEGALRGRDEPLGRFERQAPHHAAWFEPDPGRLPA